ncbi:MAG: cell division protein SepF [Trueperella sp.]|nr:cell division protein SepF [Trueperella sp.]
MGFLDRLGAKAATFDDEYEYDEYDEYDVEDYESDDPSVTEIHSVEQAPEIARIMTVWVSTYEEIKGFANEFRLGTPVILNLSRAGDTERVRIVDFALGLCFGLAGKFSKVSDDVFLLTPEKVKTENRGSDTNNLFN